MKKPSKKLIAIVASALVGVFFAGITGAMAVAGKLDLSEVPVVGDAVVSLATRVNTTDMKAGGEAAGTTLAASGGARTPSTAYTSITDVAVANGYVYAADKTGMKVCKLNTNGSLVDTYYASEQVNGVAANGNTVYVLQGVGDGKVVVLNSGMDPIATISVGHTPSAMVITGSKAYVANRFDNSVSVLNLSNNTVTSTIQIDGREAVDMALAGSKLYVACHLPEDSSRSTVISANVVVINTSTDRVTKTISLVNGAGGVKGIAASPDGGAVYVSHIIARYTYPTTQLDRGWINTNGFSVINTGTDTAVAMMLDEVDEGAANPWGIGVSSDGQKLIVAISGTDEAMIVDIPKMNNKINAVRNGNGVVSSVDRIVDYLPFLDDCRQRVSLSGKGARAVAINGNTAYIGQYFTGDVATVNLSNGSTGTLSFAYQPANDDVRTGEILFADATLCYQKWQSCLSCHPDALADGLNWDNLNDGLGNPKSAKSLLYSHRTPPTMSTGIRASAEIAVRAGMKYIQFNALPEPQMAQIDEYLKSLQPTQSPYRNADGTLTESATRGKALFESQGCAVCHPAPLYTDLKLHHSKLTETATNWESRDMDTPTLVEVWRTGPWGYDGRFATMEEAVRQYTTGKGLTSQQITDLTNYVMSIGDEGEQYGVEQVFVSDGSNNTSINVLVPSGKVASFTVRCQQEDAAGSAVVTATLTNAAGKTIKTTTHTVSGLAFNTAQTINLSGFDIPENASGVTLTITIKDGAGADIATPYVLKK